MFFIVLCCYKPHLGFLRAQIESIRAQTDADFQCLVQDDASPMDGTGTAWIDTLAAEYAHDSRFVFFRNAERLGVFHNFEAGVRKTPARAEFVCYCDQDDLWEPEKLARQRAAFTDPTVMLCHTDLALIDEQDRLLAPSCFAFENRELEDFSVPQLILRNAVTGCTLAFRASLLPALLPFPYQGPRPRFHHDHWTALVAVLFGRIATLREPLVRYRQHGGNVLGASSAEKAERPARAHLRALRQHGLSHVAALEPEWTRRLEWIQLLIDRAPPRPDRRSRLEDVIDWTQRTAGTAYLLRFAGPHLFTRDWLAEVALPVVLGKVYNGLLRAKARLRGTDPAATPGG